MKSTNFKSIDSYINTLDFLHEFNCHISIIQAIFYLVAWYLQKLQISINTVILYIDSTFYIWFHLHLNLKNIILMQNFFLRFSLNIFFGLLANNIYNIWIIHLLDLHFSHFDSFLQSNFRWLFGCIIIFIFLNNMDYFLLMHICYNINSYFWICWFYLYYVKNISFIWLFYYILFFLGFLNLFRIKCFCFIADIIIRICNCSFLFILIYFFLFVFLF